MGQGLASNSEKFRSFCKAQIGRVSGLDFFPKRVEAITQLVDVLVANSENEAHAKAVCDELARMERAPIGADILRACLALRTRVKKPRADCADCGGSGWKVGFVMRKGQRISGAERCTCSVEVAVEAA